MICIVVVLVLNMVPCADAHDHADEKLSTSISNPGETHDHANAAGDACTPFCHCSCCAATIILKLQTELTLPFQVLQSAAVRYSNDCSIDVSLTVWQPPKLV